MSRKPANAVRTDLGGKHPPARSSADTRADLYPMIPNSLRSDPLAARSPVNQFLRDLLALSVLMLLACTLAASVGSALYFLVRSTLH